MIKNSNHNIKNNKFIEWFLDTGKAISSEIKAQFTFTRFLILIFIIVFANLSVIINIALDSFNNGFELFTEEIKELRSQISVAKVKGEDFSGHQVRLAEVLRELKNLSNRYSSTMIIAPLGQGITYIIFWRIYSVFKSQTTLDKNRALFLVFNKHQVTIAKTIADGLLFLVGVLCFSGFLLILTSTTDKNNLFNTDYFSSLWIYCFTVFMIYLFISTGMRFINASISDKYYRYLTLGFWILITIIAYLVLSVLNSTLAETKDFYLDNWKWIQFVPFLNLGLPAMLLSQINNFSGSIPMTVVIPIIIESILFILIIWPKYTTNLKEFLCA